MTTFTRSDDLRGAQFVDADLRGARFVGADLSGVVMRGVAGARARTSTHRGSSTATAPCSSTASTSSRFVEAELNRRFPGRAERRAADPDGLRAAWAALERTWAATLERAAAMPAGTVDVSVDGEWSFAQTLRHLVLATDMWLGRAVLQIEQPFHPIGLLDAEHRGRRLRHVGLHDDTPSYAEVLEVRAGRVGHGARLPRHRHPRRAGRARGRTRTRPRPGDGPAPACTRSSRRSGSTTATPYATSTRSRRRPRLSRHLRPAPRPGDSSRSDLRRRFGRRRGPRPKATET